MKNAAGSWTGPITSTDVHQRSEVHALLSTDRREALAVARRISHPWYRCQALTTIAEKSLPLEERSALLSQAVSAALEQADSNRAVTVAAWPLRAMVSDSTPQISRLVGQLLYIIAGEPHGLRRLDGLAAILAAVLPSATLRAKVLPRFVEAAQVSQGWRTERIVAFMATALACVDMPAALALLEGREPNRFAAKARATIDSSAQAS